MGVKFSRKFRFEGVFEVAASGFAGVLILLWNSSALNLRILSCNDQYIHAEISRGPSSFIFSFVYVKPCSGSKEIFWDNLRMFASSVQRLS